VMPHAPSLAARSSRFTRFVSLPRAVV
jgi:hypothetical protein